MCVCVNLEVSHRCCPSGVVIYLGFNDDDNSHIFTYFLCGDRERGLECHGMCVDVRGQFKGVGLLLPSCGFRSWREMLYLLNHPIGALCVLLNQGLSLEPGPELIAMVRSWSCLSPWLVLGLQAHATMPSFSCSCWELNLGLRTVSPSPLGPLSASSIKIRFCRCWSVFADLMQTIVTWEKGTSVEEWRNCLRLVGLWPTLL